MDLSFRHWFFISLMLLVNITLFGFLLLIVVGKIALG